LPTPEKEATVAELAEQVRASQGILLADYRGLTATQINALRGRLRSLGAQMAVVKNRLLRRAVQDTAAGGIAEHLTGPTAAAFCEGDPTPVARALADAAREFPVLEIKGGYIPGRVLSANEVAVLARVPSREVLLSQVLAGLNGPVTGLVVTLNGILSQFVFTLQAIADQKSEAGAA